MTTELTRAAARILFLPMILVAIGVLVKGYADIGDGFSAGVIASLAVILQGVAFGADEFDRLPLVRYASVGTFCGLGVALLTAFIPVLRGDPIFTHRPAANAAVTHFGSLEFITAVAFDIGVFLIVFGFCVGTVSSIARAVQRLERERARGEGSMSG